MYSSLTVITFIISTETPSIRVFFPVGESLNIIIKNYLTKKTFHFSITFSEIFILLQEIESINQGQGAMSIELPSSRPVIMRGQSI